MNNLFRSVILSVVAMVGITMAAGDVSANSTDFFSISSMTPNGIPMAVLDPEFVLWQPVQPVPTAPCQINDAAYTNGFSICYNPMIMAQLPRKVQAFIFAHEYGHIYLRTSNEIEADRFAGRVYAETDMRVVRAIIWHMANMQANVCDATHPCGRDRAWIVGEAAGLSREEIAAIIMGQV